MPNRLLLLVSIAVVSITSVLASPQAWATSFPNRMKAGPYELILNGLGARKKSLLQLYVGGLYVTERSNRAGTVIAADSPMAIRIEITSRFVSQTTMVTALNQGFEKSTGGNTSPIRKEIDQFRECFSDKIAKGDVFDLVYLPSTGVVVAKNGQQKDIIKGLEFKRALFGIWLCDQPADARLKRGMLGN